MPVALDILTRKYILFKKTGYTLCAHCKMNILENFPPHFFDSVQSVRYEPRQKFDTDGKITRISAFFQIWPTRSCCYNVIYIHSLHNREKKSVNIVWNSLKKENEIVFSMVVSMPGRSIRAQQSSSTHQCEDVANSFIDRKSLQLIFKSKHDKISCLVHLMKFAWSIPYTYKNNLAYMICVKIVNHWIGRAQKEGWNFRENNFKCFFQLCTSMKKFQRYFFEYAINTVCRTSMDKSKKMDKLVWTASG